MKARLYDQYIISCDYNYMIETEKQSVGLFKDQFLDINIQLCALGSSPSGVV